MMLDPLSRVFQFVKEYDINLEPIVLATKMNTAEEAAMELGVEKGQIAKSILFCSGENYGMFVVAGDVRVHPKVMKQCLGGRKPKMVSPDEVQEITGFQIGAVCPFCLVRQVPIYIDQSLQRFDKFYTAAGIAESLLPLSFQQLVSITKGIVIDMEGKSMNHTE